MHRTGRVGGLRNHRVIIPCPQVTRLLGERRYERKTRLPVLWCVHANGLGSACGSPWRNWRLVGVALVDCHLHCSAHCIHPNLGHHRRHHGCNPILRLVTHVRHLAFLLAIRSLHHPVGGWWCICHLLTQSGFITDVCPLDSSSIPLHRLGARPALRILPDPQMGCLRLLLLRCIHRNGKRENGEESPNNWMHSILKSRGFSERVIHTLG